MVTPRKIAGFNENLPFKEVVFEDMLNKIKGVFAKNCFVPQDTPILEYADVLLAKSGGEIDKQVYRFSKGDTDMCMRYDLTVPTARYVAMHKGELSFPYRRYQIGKVFRGERPQKFRYREFYQCDADIIGQNLSTLADCECIKMIDEIFESLKLNEKIYISNRKILFGFLSGFGLDKQANDILTILDKADKISAEQVIQLLLEFGLGEIITQKLLKISSLCGKEDVLETLQQECNSEIMNQGIIELGQVLDGVRAMGLEDCKFDFKMSIVRGQDYYTGTIFETKIVGYEQFSVVCAGGRYDNLTSYFCEEKFSGVGLSVGLTRLFALLDAENMLGSVETNFVCIIPLSIEQTLPALGIANQLKKAGVACCVNYEDRSFKSKLSKANKEGAKYVIIVGEDEIKSQKFVLKDMKKSQQQNLGIEEIIKTIGENDE